jgi:hypothetical protein
MQDQSNQAAAEQLWAEYALASQQAQQIVTSMSREAHPRKRAQLRKQLRAWDAQRVQLLDQMDTLLSK